MIEVEIRNFQNISHEVIRLDGFTAIVGRSNIGKSSIVRAVKAALTGSPVDSFVRHGPSCLRVVKGTKTCECACSVHIRANEFDLFWEKGDSVNRYRFNGEENTAAGKGTPDFLEKSFGMVKVGNTKTLLQVSDQFSPIFLLDQTGNAVADLLSDVARLDRINVAMRAVEKDRKEAISSRKIREKDVIELQNRVMSFDGLDDVVSGVDALEASEVEIQSARHRIEEVDRFISVAFSLARDLESLKASTRIEIPPTTELNEKLKAASELGKLVLVIAGREKRISEIEQVDSVAAPDALALGSTRTTFERLEAWVAQLRSYKELLTKHQGIEAAKIPEVGDLASRVDSLKSLSALTSKALVLEREIQRIETALSAVGAEEEAVQEEMNAFGGICPTCTRPLGHVHSEGP